MIHWCWVLWPVLPAIAWIACAIAEHRRRRDWNQRFAQRQADSCTNNLFGHHWKYWGGEHSVRICRHCGNRQFYWNCLKAWRDHLPSEELFIEQMKWPHLPKEFWDGKAKLPKKEKT